MDIPFVDADRLKQLLTQEGAVAALELAFARDTSGLPDRHHLDVGEGDLLVMPAWSEDAAGVKLITVAAGNAARGLPLIHGVYVLFDKPTLRPVALFDAAPLTALRTAAVSAVATKHLARPESGSLLIFGAGVQGRAHLAALHDLFSLNRVRVVSRTRAEAESLVAQAASLGLDAAVGTSADLVTSDVVCTCTTSVQPLFAGKLLAPGTHVNAVGSYRPEARELDDQALEGATVVIDTVAALHESGDLVVPLQDGVIQRSDVRLLSEVIEGGGRRSAEDITIFKSVGAAFEDLAVAEAAAAQL